MAKLDALPEGYSVGHYQKRKYSVTKTILSGGRNQKLYAEELGGLNHISFNLYRLKDGTPLLKPCEMPEQKVIDFVLEFEAA